MDDAAGGCFQFQPDVAPGKMSLAGKGKVRAFKKDVLLNIDYEKLDNDFIFDNQILSWFYFLYINQYYLIFIFKMFLIQDKTVYKKIFVWKLI